MSLSQLKAKIENANDISWELGIRNEKNLIHEIDEMAYFQSFFISRVAFYNYKNFSSVNGIPFSIRLSSKKNQIPNAVLIGINGAGKTNLITAIARGLSWLDAGISGEQAQGKRLTESDISYNKSCNTAEFSLSITLPKLAGETRTLTLRTTRRGSTEAITNDVASFRSLGRSLRILANEYGHSLPILLYYPANRFVSKGVDTGNIRADENNFTSFPAIDWLIKHFKIISSNNREDSEFSNLVIKETRELLCKIFESLKNIKLDQSSGEDEIIIVWENDLHTKFMDLSLGQKSFMILFLDILMNILLKSKGKASKQRGIILIDEIENHLHPSWQRKIFPTLRKVFPDIQIIATTHSPFVVQTVPKSEIYLLDSQYPTEAYHPQAQTEGSQIDSLIARVFDLSDRGDQKIVILLSDCEAHIRAKQIDKAKQELFQLKLHFGNDDPYVNYLDVLLTTKK